MNNPPIFLRPMGRTGGTLFVTILDAHRQIAMSYEIYQERLFSDDGNPLDLAWAIHTLKKTAGSDGLMWVKQIPDKNFKTFVARARRGNIEVYDILAMLERFHEEGKDFSSLSSRLDFIENLMMLKMQKTGKQYWGGKANMDPWELYKRHPKARFFAMVRDGRDVLASKLNVGNFQTDAKKCAEEWREGLLSFHEFMKNSGAYAMEIHYETLVSHPETVLRDVCAFIGAEYDSGMLNFHRKDMDLFKNPHGHLSHKQIAQGLNSESIGRWKRDLSKEEIQIFEVINRDLLIKYNYIKVE